MMLRRVMICGTLIMSLLVAGSLCQNSTTKPERPMQPVPIGITHEQADAILHELRQIRQLLEEVPQSAENEGTIPQLPSRAIMTASPTWHSIGRDDAPVTIIEFTDYQCPFCRRFHTNTFVELKRQYIDTGQVRFVSRDMPLPFHSSAMIAAEAARCAGKQDKFWQMRDSLFSNAQGLSAESILKDAREAGLDIEAFQRCLSSGSVRADVQKDAADAMAISVSATPSFVVAKTSQKELDGELLIGAQPLTAFDAAIKRARGDTAAKSAGSGCPSP